MKGIFINCPSCKKMLFKNAYFRIGSYLTTKCFYCGMAIDLIAEPSKITLKMMGQAVDKSDLPDDEESDILLVHL